MSVFKKINEENLHLIEKFLININSPYFRYFNKRKISIVLTHIYTVILTSSEDEKSDIIGYGHIEEENNIHWMGICITNNYTNKGYGSKILSHLIQEAKKCNINKLYLTVDKNNDIALNLYKKYNFQMIESNETFYKMYLLID